ncbi:MAG: thioredoxin domain-containing protein [Acidobacteriota bacterium]|nr:thioredoxin domain-containing protein [Acidobacteriota bacterium]
MRRKYTVFALCLCALCLEQGSSLFAQQEGASEIIANIRDKGISLAELEAAVEKELHQLEMDSLAFEAVQKQKKYDVLEKQLRAMMSAELFKLEAAERAISRDDLLEQEVYSKMQSVTEQDVESFYATNRSRIREPKVQVLPMIRRHLTETKMNDAQQSFVDRLKEKYQVYDAFGPFRLDIATEGHPFLGPVDAPVTVVEFSDFECPYCLAMFGSLKTLRQKYGEKIRFVFRQFPLNRIHPRAQKAAEASLCAADQGKFWELHDAMFEDQDGLKVPDLESKAEFAGMDMEEFKACLNDARYSEHVKQDIVDGTAAGVLGTPALFINGRPLLGSVPYEEITKLVDEELRPDGRGK